MPVIPSLSLTISPYTALYTSLVPDAIIAVSTSTDQGRTEIVLDFNGGDGVYSRDLGTVFSWPTNPSRVIDVWQPSIVDLPENIYNRASDWMDGGYPGAKFIQGYEIEADTFGTPKTFQLQSSDDLSIHSLNEMPATFAKQNVQYFSCTPFIAHNVRRVSSDGVPSRVFRETLMFQPFPELTKLWQTELTSLGGVGWQHIMEMNIPYISTATATLTVQVDSGSNAPASITIPNSSGAQAKLRVTPTFNKFKLAGFQVSSSAGFRIFQEDVEVKIKVWGSSGPYRVIKPFGGKSSAGAEV